MPVLTYTADFREKDGEIISSTDFVSNIKDIESVANNLDWMNVENRSLSNFHISRGKATKSAGGSYIAKRGFSSGSYTAMGILGYPVSPGCAVYAVAEVSWSNAAVQYDAAGPIDPIGDVHNPSGIVLGAVDETGLSMGTRMHTNASSPSVHGSAGLVWAYRPPPTSSPVNYMTLAINFLNGGLTNADFPALGNLTVFVVHR